MINLGRGKNGLEPRTLVTALMSHAQSSCSQDTRQSIETQHLAGRFSEDNWTSASSGRLNQDINSRRQSGKIAEMSDLSLKLEHVHGH